MKNLPHQFNDLNKLFEALAVAKRLIDNDIPLNDDNFGKQLTREGIHAPRDKTLSINEYFQSQQEKSSAFRGYETASREIRRFLESLGFIIVSADKTATLNPTANLLLETESEDARQAIWKEALRQLRLEGEDGDISHPYRILLKLVNTFPGIETSKLMLALEAENDSDKEFERISKFVELTKEQIIEELKITKSKADNAVKILPKVAEQLGDIEKVGNKVFPTGLTITEDGITGEEGELARRTTTPRKVTAEEIAPEPNFQDVPSTSIDPTEANRIRQKRHKEHNQIVRLLAKLNEDCGFKLFEYPFDLLATKEKTALLYEIKTILESASDTEKQTVKGVGQLKFYKFSIVHKQMGYTNIKEILVFSRQPAMDIIEFCLSENILVVWREDNNFKIFNRQTLISELFNPDNLL